jgi:O-antigen ligase
MVIAVGAAVLIASLPIWAGKLQAWAEWAAAGGVLLVVAAGWATAAGLRKGMTPAAKLLLAALIVAGLALFTSVAPYESVRMLLLFTAALALLMLSLDLPIVAAALGWAVAAGGAIAGLWGLREYFMTWAIMGDTSWRPFAGFLNPNALAGYLLVAVPALVAAFASFRRQAEGKQPGHPARVLWLVAAILAGLGTVTLLLTASKGALLGAVVAAAVSVLVRGRRRLLMGGALIVVVAGVLLLPPVRHRVAAAFSSQQGSSVGFRARTWAGTFDLARARPLLGWGPGSFRHAYPRFARVGFTAEAHESWLQWAAECGVPAAVLLLAALAALGWGLSRRPGPWATAALFALTGTLIHNLFDYTWYLPPVLLGLFALMGAGLAEEVAPAEGRPRRVGLLIAALLALGVVTSGWFCLAEVASVRADMLAREGYPYAALAIAENAASRAGFSSDAWVEVGKIAEGLAGAAHDSAGLARAAEHYERAIAVCPSEPAGYIGAARCLREAGLFEEARRWAEAGTHIYPGGPAMLLEYAHCLEAAGDEAHALDVYRAVMALADADYGRYVSLEGWADHHLAEASSAVARATKSPDERLRAWRTAGRVTASWLEWNLHYRASLEIGGQADSGRMSEMCSLALDAAAALTRTGHAGDDALAAKLRKLAERATAGR